MSPLLAEAHDDGAALGIVVFQANLHDGRLSGDAELLVDLVLDGQAVGIPAEATLDVEALHGPVSGDDVLDGRGQEMAIMRQAGRERGAIVEGVERSALGELDLEHLWSASRAAGERRSWVGDSTCLSKALMARHLSMVASSSLGKSMDMFGQWLAQRVPGIQGSVWGEMDTDDATWTAGRKRKGREGLSHVESATRAGKLFSV